jgi:hypothetical protein
MGNRLRGFGNVLSIALCFLLFALIVGGIFTLAGLCAALFIQEIRFGTRAQSADAEVAEAGPQPPGAEHDGPMGINLGLRNVLVRSNKLPHDAIVAGWGWWDPPKKGEHVPILFEPDPGQIGPCDMSPIRRELGLSWNETTGVKLDSFWQRYFFPLLGVLVGGGCGLGLSGLIISNFRELKGIFITELKRIFNNKNTGRSRPWWSRNVP